MIYLRYTIGRRTPGWVRPALSLGLSVANFGFAVALVLTFGVPGLLVWLIASKAPLVVGYER